MTWYAIALCVVIALSATGVIVGGIKTKTLHDYAEKYLDTGLVQLAGEKAESAVRWANFALACAFVFLAAVTVGLLNL